MIQPASKGPFRADGDELLDCQGKNLADFIEWPDGAEVTDVANARYFAHAANQLPECIKAMERSHAAMKSTIAAIVGVMSDDVCDQISNEASALKAAIEAAKGNT